MKLVRDVAKAAQEQAEKTWGFAKRATVGMMCWGLVFSLVTIGELRVGFDYDDTLVFSTPAFSKAFASGKQPFSPDFWKVVNASYDVEKKKLTTNALAWAFRILGFRVTVLTSRPEYGGDALRKEWRHLSRDFHFAGGSANKHKILEKGNHVLYFGDSDSDIVEGRKAEVMTFRIKRSPDSSYKDDYKPGSLREIVIPFTDF